MKIHNYRYPINGLGGDLGEDFRALTRCREAEEPVETVASATSFGSWDAEVRLQKPKGAIKSTFDAYRTLLFLKSFSACEVLDLCKRGN